MKIIPKTQKDFEWVRYTPKQINAYVKTVIEKIDHDVEAIKKIPKEKRTFENTIYALDQIGETGAEDNPVSFLQYVSGKEDVRKAARDYQEVISKKSIDVSFDEGLYNAFKEYNPKKEKLSGAEKMLYKWTKIGFENQGFHLPKKKQLELKKIKKELTDLSISFSKNISEYHDFILCTKEELSGLPDSYIANLEIDQKTKKYMVSLSYPEFGPFMQFADNDTKRKELADKVSQKGGVENIKILSKMLKLRKKLAQILGYESFATVATKDKIAKKPENVKKFLEGTISKLKPAVVRDYKKLSEYVNTKFPGKKLNYYNTAYFSTKMKEDLYSYDQKKVKEYFELNHVIEKMFEIFGNLFSVTFVENTALHRWHKDVKLFDVLEKGKVIGHIALDLYPRKNKFSHMACWNLIPGKNKSFRSSEYLAPVSVVVGNFPIGTKKNPSLLSIGEMKTLFHEFGHMSHDYLARAPFASQAGTNVVFDFVETPSQLFENWVTDKKNLKMISRHHKTGEHINDDLLDRVMQSLDFMKASNFYRIFVMSLQDYEMHTDKWNANPLKIDREFNKRYGFFKQSPKSLFPASWGHMTDYAAKYYSYMWAIVYSYDLFSRFKEEGILNKKVGMELRKKILEKGGSEDELSQVKSFLGRKPNNKAFLEELGIKK